MNEIDSSYEILFEDLKKFGIGNFLISRNFKVLMTKYLDIERWNKTLKLAENGRSYFSPDTNHYLFDSLNVFLAYLNHIKIDKTIEADIALMISWFIDSFEFREDFKTIVESAELSGFNNDSMSFILDAVAHNEEKSFKKSKLKGSKSLIQSQNKNNSKRVFIVHGHNNEIKLDVARTLEQLGLKAIILHEESNAGQTIIEKFEKHSDVSYAIVLLTADDQGSIKSEQNLSLRARQNVVLELGYFLAKLGRSKVLPLYEMGVEIPSDISGVLYTELDPSGHWKFRMVKELKAAGFDIDINKLID